ncbi:threonine aspartase 1 [Asbolus verrucosus]|uniref:Threonine aspartase 1 n=1 Tax=Asbolus verrucosus TaxID=1661398 RepID=A0A482VGL0_ASBVE|nr:threonine aspartase 1 [Asbolus verrucosus]
MAGGIVAVHCGNHKSNYYSKYNRLSKKACRKGIEVLKNGGSALEAVKAVITKDDPLTNSGYGSNLTDEGQVEGDASVMDGKTLLYGGCGAVENVKNPIHLAYDLCIKQTESLPLGLIPPSLLVGKGGVQYAKSVGLKIVNRKSLISTKALLQYKKYKKLLEHSNKGKELLDTVGAVCMDESGHVAAGCSSGGILLKRPGRVGQAAIYASGVWADSFNQERESSVAVCTSGCGEHLIRTQLAKEIAEDVKNSSCPTLGLSQYLSNVAPRLCGALVLHVNNKTGDIAVLWGHTTESMSIGFMRCIDENPKAVISQLPKEISVGSSVNVSGVYTYNNKDSKEVT